MVKKIILKFFHFIRHILTALRNHCSPFTTPLRMYEMFEKEQIKNCYETFKTHFQKSILLDYKNYHKFIIERAKENDPLNKKFYLEFGVWKGTTINIFSKYVNTIYGFDSFEGLREDWAGTSCQKGTNNLNKKLPVFNKNVIPVIGWVQDTLGPFLDKHKTDINFVHLDMDTYESTKFVLTKIKPYLTKNCYIAFDELYNYPGWEMGEYRALKETFNDNEYKYVCFSKDGTQVMIQVV